MKIFSAVLLLLAFAVSPAHARPEVKEVVAALEEGYRSLKDVEARFTQRSMVAGIGREQRGEGEMALKKGSSGSAMFRFDYRKPEPQQIIFNGKTVWLYQPAARQVVVSSAEGLLQGEAGLAISYLTGLGSISRDFTPSWAQEGGADYVIDLVPKRQGGVLQKLRLTVSAKAVDAYLRDGKVRDPFPVLSSAVYDRQGNRNVMDFSRVRANRGIDSSRFNFRVPDGVQVLQNQ